MERTVDLAAINRVAKRSELKNVRLTAISANCDPHVLGPSLTPTVDLDCTIGEHGAYALQVVCNYKFIARVEEKPVLESMIRYLLDYEISGSESPSEDDLTEFARANGALHSWPFAREVLYGITSRMGYPPYTLPVVHFSAKAKAKPNPKAKEESPVMEPAGESDKP